MLMKLEDNLSHQESLPIQGAANILAQAGPTISQNEKNQLNDTESNLYQASTTGFITLDTEPDNDLWEAEDGSENDGFFNDEDSAFGEESVASSFMSIDDSIVFQFEENGRQYHSHQGKRCVFPTDEEELSRQDFQQDLCFLTLQGLSLAPLPKMHRVLDVGTGTGSWAIDFAGGHPEAVVIGVDLAPIQRNCGPPNIQFELDDLEKTWTFSKKFDYIHSAMMEGTFTDWPRFYQQAFNNLNPGGYLETQEICYTIQCVDGSMPSDCNLARWSDLIMKAATKLGQPLNSCTYAKRMMEVVGFEDVIQIPFIWPQNSWPRNKRYKELGMWAEENFVGGIEAMSLALLTRGLGWTKDEVNVLLSLVEHDIRDRSIHAYWPFQVVYGRRP